MSAITEEAAGCSYEKGAKQATSTADSLQQQLPPVKRKRNIRGTPDPDVEVIALSPRTLLNTNQYVCEICNKGFQRSQNLELHRRGHNLPWNLKQRTEQDIKKKVFVCPMATCAQHDPSRALSDLTGIKKHFCRKHGEKKWKCDKCFKRYAVQSDWKAHLKACSTREYRCNCGIVFCRRDSFITHRAFCDVLLDEYIPLSVHQENESLDALGTSSTGDHKEGLATSPYHDGDSQFSRCSNSSPSSSFNFGMTGTYCQAATPLADCETTTNTLCGFKGK